MPIDLTKVNLDAPAFGPEAADVKEAGTTETPAAEAPQAESGVTTEEGNPPTSGGEPDATEQRVPYSRHAEVVQQRREAERKAEESEARYQELLRSQSARNDDRPAQSDGELPSYWVSMYGDNENSKNAYRYELERQRIVSEEVRREALEAVREERHAETQAITRNERTIEDRLEDLSGQLGRPLTDTEESAVLDIVDEYTPVGDDGRYAGDLISMDKAWEIYGMRQAAQGQRSARARSAPTALTSAQTQGEPSGRSAADSEWNPRDWNGWKKRIPG